MKINKIFEKITRDIPEIAIRKHTESILHNASVNFPKIKKSIKKLPSLSRSKANSGIIVGAGPSIHKNNSIQRILNLKYQGTLIAIDATYISCLKAGIIPDYVLTLDPHPTRVVRWFGDHEFRKNSKEDDYFLRQDLAMEFRHSSRIQNKKNIHLVNKFGHLTKAIVSTSAPSNVVQRLEEAKFDCYWWNPLVDDPSEMKSTTRKLYQMNQLPCINTGGNVATAAWVFAAAILKLRRIGLVGMDFGYYRKTPYTQTQTYYELIEHLGLTEDVAKCFVEFVFPLTGKRFYTDPTYFWYRKNFLELHKNSIAKTYNCTEGGILFHKDLKCITLDQFIIQYG